MQKIIEHNKFPELKPPSTLFLDKAKEGKKNGEKQQKPEENPEKENTVKDSEKNKVENSEKIKELEELVKKINQDEKARFEKRFGKGLWGKVNHWLNNTDKGKMVKMSAKIILGGTALVSVTAMSGGSAIWLAPLVYGAGSKNVIDGAIEAVQYFAKGGGRNRLKMEAEKQNTLLSLKSKAKKLFSGEKKDQDNKEMFMSPEEYLINTIKVCEQNVSNVITENMKAEARAKLWRTILSSTATIGFGLVNGIPLGIQNFDGKEMSHHVFWSLRKGLEFVYNTGEKLAQTHSSNLFGLATHTMGEVGTKFVPSKLLVGPATAIIGTFIKEGAKVGKTGWQKIHGGGKKILDQISQKKQNIIIEVVSDETNSDLLKVDEISDSIPKSIDELKKNKKETVFKNNENGDITKVWLDENIESIKNQEYLLFAKKIHECADICFSLAKNDIPLENIKEKYIAFKKILIKELKRNDWNPQVFFSSLKRNQPDTQLIDCFVDGWGSLEKYLQASIISAQKNNKNEKEDISPFYDLPVESNRTVMAVENLEKNGLFEKGDEESPYGYFVSTNGQKYPVLGRNSEKINGGVYPGGSDREILVVDDQDETIRESYNELKSQLDQFFKNKKNRHEKDILQKVYAYVEEKMPFDENRVNMIIAFKENQLNSLGVFIRMKAGVCRHQALFVAYLLEKLKEENYLKGNFSMERNSIKQVGAHVWIRYTRRDGLEYILDTALRFFGTKKEAKKKGAWKYELENRK
ncbi:MAG: hypothetical protein ACOZAR_01385 [Patescibacteria group bacterium]